MKLCWDDKIENIDKRILQEAFSKRYASDGHYRPPLRDIFSPLYSYSTISTSAL